MRVHVLELHDWNTRNARARRTYQLERLKDELEVCLTPGCWRKREPRGTKRRPTCRECRGRSQQDVARLHAVPMSMIDGRPWVPTAAEADAEAD